jgi:hypothetical protein
VVTGAYNAAVTNSGIAQNLNIYIYIFFVEVYGVGHIKTLRQNDSDPKSTINRVKYSKF